MWQEVSRDEVRVWKGQGQGKGVARAHVRPFTSPGVARTRTTDLNDCQQVAPQMHLLVSTAFIGVYQKLHFRILMFYRRSEIIPME